MNDSEKQDYGIGTEVCLDGQSLYLRNKNRYCRIAHSRFHPSHYSSFRLFQTPLNPSFHLEMDIRHEADKLVAELAEE